MPKPRPPATISQRRRCFARLGLTSTASEAEVIEAYRRLAATRHPDVGGNAAEFNSLENAYRECLRLVSDQPQISGKPSRDNFFPMLPQSIKQLATWRFSTFLVLVVLPCIAVFNPKVAVLASAFLAPLFLGCLIAQLPPGVGLFVSCTALSALGIGWLAALYKISWISYAFAMVPARDGSRMYVSAVAPEKQFWLIVSMCTTAFALFTIGVGCLVSISRSRG